MWAAPMIPLPAPVTTIQPDSAILRPNSTALSWSECAASVRAEPKTVTFLTWR
jgi:hypothetical protein